MPTVERWTQILVTFKIDLILKKIMTVESVKSEWHAHRFLILVSTQDRNSGGIVLWTLDLSNGFVHW